MVIPQSGPFLRDFGVSQFSFNGSRLESWNKDRKYSRHLRTLARSIAIEHPTSICQCHHAWLISSKGLRQRLGYTLKSA